MKNKLVNPTERCMSCGKLSKTSLCDACRKPKKIKVIDLYNMIANGKELPKRIKYDDLIWNKANIGDNWFNENLMLWFSTIIDTSVLNNEIEIVDELEETEDLPTISEEQALFNKLNSKDQEYVLNFMKMLQPCEDKRNGE